jgi:hypothetical protein
MRLGFVFALTAMAALAVPPAFAQSPGGSTMPAGTQNPAVAQPRLVTPLELMARPQPAATPSSQPTAGPQPDDPSPASMIIPGGAGGLCECLINHDPGVPAIDKNRMHQACLASVEACQAVCNSPRVYSFVPHAVYSCPGRPGEVSRPVAANDRSVVRLATATSR